MAMSAEHRSKFAVLYWQWWRLHASAKLFSSGTKKPYKQTIKKNILYCNTATTIIVKNENGTRFMIRMVTKPKIGIFGKLKDTQTIRILELDISEKFRTDLEYL